LDKQSKSRATITKNKPLRASSPMPTSTLPCVAGQSDPIYFGLDNSMQKPRQQLRNVTSTQHKSCSFLEHLLHFNHLLLHKNHSSKQSIVTLLPMRMSKLSQVRLRELCNDAFSFLPETTGPKPNAILDNDGPSFDIERQFCPEAQAAAISGDFCTACQQILFSLPVAKLQPEFITRTTTTLFPPPSLSTLLETTNLAQLLNPLSQAPECKNNLSLTLSVKSTLTTPSPLHEKPKEEQLPDLFVILLMRYETTQPSDPNLPTIQNLNPPSAHAALTTSHAQSNWRLTVTSLSPSRQRSAVTVSQHSTKTQATSTKSDLWAQVRPFAEQPQPTPSLFQVLMQQNVSFHKANLELASQVVLTSSFTQQWPTFIECHLNQTAPTGALLLLDIVNIFNAVSREAYRSVLKNHKTFCALVPFFDTPHPSDNVCWHREPVDAFSTFSQAEGFAQGCPLSPFFASFVLHVLLTDLNKEPRDRSKKRQANH
jgi:hypothetical protein